MKKKTTTVKQHQERINRALIYIQKNINEPITLGDLERISHFSRFHFHRIFTAHTGESLAAYIRRLKLQQASKQLVYGDDSITHIGLNAGFETPSSFTKAFKQQTGLTPKDFRARGTVHEYSDGCSSRLPTLGEVTMKPSQKTLSDQPVIFIRRKGSYHQSAPDAWITMGNYFKQKGWPEDRINLIGIAHDDPSVSNENNWRFDACIAGLENPTADGEIGVQTIAGGKYAMFEHIGPYNTMGNTYRKIFGEWYPESGVTLRDEPTFAQYVDRNFSSNDYSSMTDAEKSKLITHIYVPIN